MTTSHDPHCRIGKVTPHGNVELFPGVTHFHLPARLQPDDEVISFLARLLFDASEGDVRGLGVAWIDGEGNTAINWAGGEGYPCTLLLGAMQLLALQYAAKAMSSSSVVIDPKEPA
jgi:hypothetical protein